MKREALGESKGLRFEDSGLSLSPQCWELSPAFLAEDAIDAMTQKTPRREGRKTRDDAKDASLSPKRSQITRWPSQVI